MVLFWASPEALAPWEILQGTLVSVTQQDPTQREAGKPEAGVAASISKDATMETDPSAED